MNYIELINQFWRLNEEHSFTCNEVALYFYLLHTANKLGWKNPFTQSNGYIINALNISEPTLIRVRNSLKTFGLLDFKSEKGRKSKTQYELKYLNNLSISVSNNEKIIRKNLKTLSIPVSNNVSICDSIPVSISTPEAQCLQGSSDPLNKTKNKQNKTIEANDTALASSEGEAKGKEKAPPPGSAPPPSQYPSLDEVTRFFEITGGTAEMAEKFWNKWDGLGWEDRGTPIKRWPGYAKNFIVNYKQNEQQNGRKSGPGKEAPKPSGVSVPPGERKYERL